MRNAQPARWTGVTGIAGTLSQIAAFAVFLIGAGSPPSAPEALTSFLRHGHVALQTSFLLWFLGFAFWFVFFAGLRGMIVEAAPRLEFFGTAFFALGAAIMVVGYACLGMMAAATANAVAVSDDTVIYTLYMGGSVIDGAPSAAPAVGLLAVAGWALFQSRLLHRWSAWFIICDLPVTPGRL